MFQKFQECINHEWFVYKSWDFYKDFMSKIRDLDLGAPKADLHIGKVNIF